MKGGIGNVKILKYVTGNRDVRHGCITTRQRAGRISGPDH